MFSYDCYDRDAKEERAISECCSDCYGCKNNYLQTDFKYRNQSETEKLIEKSLSAMTVKAIKVQFEENCKVIAKYANDPLSKDAAELDFHNTRLFAKLDHIAIFPAPN